LEIVYSEKPVPTDVNREEILFHEDFSGPAVFSQNGPPHNNSGLNVEEQVVRA
jgi:hypothetical protein